MHLLLQSVCCSNLKPRAGLLHHLAPLQWRRSAWSMKKDSELEKALSRNRRWIVNNQIKNILIRSPNRMATVQSLQKRFKSLDLQGRALNWLRKYPCCFDVFADPAGSGEALYGFSKRMAALVDEEEAVRASAEEDMATRLAKILMLSRDRRLNVVKLDHLKRSFGLPDDFVLRIVVKNSDLFRVVSRSGRRSSMEIELVNWDPNLAVSSVEAASAKLGRPPQFSCALPQSWVKTRAKFEEFNKALPYVSPYSGEMIESEQRAVSVVHELLSITLWKKLSIVKLGKFRKEFSLPDRLGNLLLRHPCLFYVSNRYKIHTVVLREGYRGCELVDKHPLVAVKDRLGELMQEGLHEYNRRRHLVNLEKRRKRGEITMPRSGKGTAGIGNGDDDDDDESMGPASIYLPEERRRFYQSLFDDPP
ncbi:ubiquitin carboxyl-terminal hydrolase family protein [Wolffia australiana]